MITAFVILASLLLLDLLASRFGRDTSDADDWFDHRGVFEKNAR